MNPTKFYEVQVEYIRNKVETLVGKEASLTIIFDSFISLTRLNDYTKTKIQEIRLVPICT